MIDLKKIFTNHFDSENIGDNRLKGFSEDHISKLSAWLTQHADAELTVLRDDLVLKHTAYFGAIDSEKAKFNLQQSRTKAVDNAWEAALNFIRYAESIVIFKWGHDGAVYQEFFPHGLTEYTRATKLTKAGVLSQFLTAANAHSIDLPGNFVMDFTTLKNDWESKYIAQQTQIGLVKDANSQTASVRQPVENQLAKHVLTIALKNIGQPDMVSDFFNQSLLRPQKENIPANSIVIRGKITYGIGTPVVGATISVQGTNPPAYTTQTDEDGKYEFTFNHVQPGENHATLTVTAQGFQVHSQEINPEFGEVTVINVTLDQQMQVAA